MKPTKLIIKNIGKIADTTIDINKPLILFYGEIKQGKTTILNCVRWVCGGEFPDDIISHGASEGSIELQFEAGMIQRSFYRAKTGETKARAVVFVKNGKPVNSPVAEIKRLLNPFLLDQDFLRNKTELERKQYFTELFAVDTTALDSELFSSQRDAQAIRAKIAGYGEIDLTEVKPVDITKIQQELVAIRKTSSDAQFNWERDNEKIKTGNVAWDKYREYVKENDAEILSLKEKIAALEKENDGYQKYLAENPKHEELPRPPIVDTVELEKKIQEAGATNVRAELYKANLVRHAAKVADGITLSEMEKRQREIKQEKQAKLKSISETSGIKGLSFDDSGNFIYDGTTAGMISDSQIMRLSSELSALYPDGFGLQLLDRGESLGKSIFSYKELAESRKTSILCSIVGEKPASVPENIGVWVVKDGVVCK